MRCLPLSSSANICCIVLSTLRSLMASGCTISISGSGSSFGSSTSAWIPTRCSTSSRADSGISQAASDRATNRWMVKLTAAVVISRRRLRSVAGIVSRKKRFVPAMPAVTFNAHGGTFWRCVRCRFRCSSCCRTGVAFFCRAPPTFCAAASEAESSSASSEVSELESA